MCMGRRVEKECDPSLANFVLKNGIYSRECPLMPRLCPPLVSRDDVSTVRLTSRIYLPPFLLQHHLALTGPDHHSRSERRSNEQDAIIRRQNKISALASCAQKQKRGSKKGERVRAARFADLSPKRTKQTPPQFPAEVSSESLAECRTTRDLIIRYCHFGTGSTLWTV